MDTDKIKNALVNHFEKIIFGGVVAASGFLIYQGIGKENYLAKLQPEKLISEANEVKLRIDDDHSDAFVTDRAPTDNILKKTRELYKPVDPTAYSFKNTLTIRDGAGTIRRQDPLLMPIVELQTTGVVCSIAFAGARTPDGYAAAQDLEPADEFEKAEKKKSRKKPRVPGGMGPGGMGPGGMDEMMMQQMMGGMGGMGGMGPGGPAPGGKGKKGRRGDDSEEKKAWRMDDKFDRGFVPVASGSTNNPQPKLGWFIAGTALLPHREIYEAFEMAFEDANGYEPRRDTPIYYDLQVQRADVTQKSVDDLSDDDWKLVWDRKKYTLLASKLWSGFAPEIVEQDYRDDNITMWIPPVLLDDYGDFATHPKIPLLSQMDLRRRELDKDLENADETVDYENFDFENQELDLTGPQSGARGGMAGGMAGGMGMEMGMMSGMGGMGMMSRGKIETSPVEHKLIRFYDFARNPPTADPNRVYVYRLRYAVVDPNFPNNPMMQPKANQMAADTVARVMKKMEKALATKERDFSMWSPWSDPSEPTTMPALQESFAGTIDPGSVSVWEVGGREVKYQRDPPTTEMALTQMDEQYGIRAQVLLKEVGEGSVLSKDAKVAQAVDPITREVKALPDYKIVGRSTIIDLDGGTELDLVEDLTEPSWMLIYDDVTGKLILSDNVSDHFEFRMNTYAEERGK